MATMKTDDEIRNMINAMICVLVGFRICVPDLKANDVAGHRLGAALQKVISSDNNDNKNAVYSLLLVFGYAHDSLSEFSAMEDKEKTVLLGNLCRRWYNTYSEEGCHM